MIELDEIKSFSLFGGMDDRAIDLVVPLLADERFPAGEIIIRQGDLGDRIYFIRDGAVAVAVNGVHIADLAAGDQFGEMHLVDIMPRSATVIATEAVAAWSLTNRDFLALRRRDPDVFITVMLNCARDISRRLRNTDNKLVEYVRKTER